LGVAKFYYSYVLLFIALCAVGVNFAFHLRITRSWRIFLATDAAVLALYSAWDIYAVKHHNWRFDPHQILGLTILGTLPIEEILFFIIVPLMTILSYLALSKLFPKLAVGDKR
jgi:lycopene cyclase domain-containing protein